MGDLVGVFKYNTPTSPREKESRLKKTKNDLYVANVKPAGPQGNELAIALMDSKRHDESDLAALKPSQARGSQRRRSTGTNVMTRSNSRLSKVGEGAAGGKLGSRLGRRNRRSSGFLSLLGYALKS